MKLKKLGFPLSVCQVESLEGFDLGGFCFVGVTDEELSLVCPTDRVPENTTKRTDGWRGFRIEGVLDFGLVGILSRITGILAEEGISVFAVSTFNTDYVLVKEDFFGRALELLSAQGYEVID